MIKTVPTCVCCLLLFAGAAHAGVKSTVAGLEQETRAIWAYQAVMANQVIRQHHESQLMVPASVLKLVVSAAALHYLGSHYTVQTTLDADAPITAGRLSGNLIIKGVGDPTWNEHFYPEDPNYPLQTLIHQLAAQGLKHITGDLLVDRSRFSGPAQPLIWPALESALGYGAPVSSLAVDENQMELQIAPGSQPGEPGRILSSLESFMLENQLLTVSAAQQGKGTVTFIPSLDRHTLQVTGEYPNTEPVYRAQLSVPDPDWYAASRLVRLLAQHKITLAGTVRMLTTPPATRIPLAHFESLPLAQWLPPILTQSKNWYAETLLRILAYQQRQQGRLDTGLALLADFLQRSVGIKPQDFYLVDASGLSTANLITPQAIVQLLRYIWQQPWRDSLVSALATPASGTLASWGKLPPLKAKTGTVQHTLGLAGYYFKPQQAQPIVFVIITNHYPGERSQIKQQMVAWINSL